MNDNELKILLEKEAREQFKGWDFTYLTNSGRMQEFPLPWNYRSVIEPVIRNSSSLLDLGTGGGEFLDSLSFLPAETSATENYDPNLEIARKRLSKRGIEVRKIHDDIIPFEDNRFDAIIDRHESYLANEVKRTLNTNGIFITQQVGGQNNRDLRTMLGYESFEFEGWCLCKAVDDIEKEGMKIIRHKECLTKTRFYDIGAIVYLVKCLPWEFPDFSIEKSFDKLKTVSNMIDKDGYIDFVNHRFLITAIKK